jgi:hypothetical protein
VASKCEVTTTSNGHRVSLWWTMDVETGQATGSRRSVRQNAAIF